MSGAHVNLMPEQALNHADAVAIGESKHTFPNIIIEDPRLSRLGCTVSTRHRRNSYPDELLY
ncbi:MAG: hypothetical protein ACPLPR_10450 [Bacillota bacterium]